MPDIFTNPIAMRVSGGTLPGDVDLCASCRYAIHRQGSQSGFDEVRCGAIQHSPLVPEKMARCSSYLEKGKLSLNEMNDMAWIIEERGKYIGFLSPEELMRRRQGDQTSAPSIPKIGFA